MQVSIKKLNHKTGKLTQCTEQSVQVDGQSVARIAFDCKLKLDEIPCVNIRLPKKIIQHLALKMTGNNAGHFYCTKKTTGSAGGSKKL